VQIYIGRDGKRYGPLSLDELNAHLESGRVQQGDLAWFEGAAGWGPISSVPGVRLPKLDVLSRLPPVVSHISRNAEQTSSHSSAPSSDVSLWNPNAAVNWSILFGAPLGSFLHARNWGSMGENGKKKRSLVWFWTTATLTAAAIIFPVDKRVYGGVWLWSLILWYFISARAQAKYVRETYGSSYRRKGFVKPLLIALACYIAVGIISFGIDVATGRVSLAGSAITPAQQERPPVVPPAPATIPAPQASTGSGEQNVVINAPSTVRVERLTLGSSVDSGQQVVGETTTFSPEQTIYASVRTTGVAPAATLLAKWFYRENGELANASSQVISPNGPATTSFHISKPDGWPVGGYQVQIYVDNVLAAKQDFKVSPRQRSETTADAPIAAKCLLEVSGEKYIDGRCPVFMNPDGSFQISASENEPLTYFATVTITGQDVGNGFWNEERGASHAHTPLGVLHRRGACWENATSKVCAERVSDAVASSSSVAERPVAAQDAQNVTPAHADPSKTQCPTTFETGRWSSAENEHGLVMTATDGEKLYIGKSCDVTSSRFGNGRWGWSNAGVLFRFDTCSIGWPHAEPPVEDNDCQGLPDSE